MKKKLAIIFGGKSGEHEVSIASAISVYLALDKNKYDISMIGIDKTGRWTSAKESDILEYQNNPRDLQLNKLSNTLSLLPYESDRQIVNIDSERKELNTQMSSAVAENQCKDSPQRFDVILPILHGTFGEDGTIQGLLELSNIPYVGSGVLGSSVGMDKDVSRRLLHAAGIPVVPTLVFKKSQYLQDPKEVLEEIKNKFTFPVFVKPANMGSSVGVCKIKNESEMSNKIDLAFQYDNKILVEKAIDARELECSVLGNDFPETSIVGEIIPNHEFYSYEAKYLDENGATLQIPAKNISDESVAKIKYYAGQAFKVLECSGLARVDFFLDKKNGEIFLNEINTMPGFTKISMYPKLWQASGIEYSQLLDRLIELAIEKHFEKNKLKTNFI